MARVYTSYAEAIAEGTRCQFGLPFSFSLPAITVHWHEVPSDNSKAGHDQNGQSRLFRNAAISISDAAREKREALLPGPVKQSIAAIGQMQPEARKLVASIGSYVKE